MAFPSDSVTADVLQAELASPTPGMSLKLAMVAGETSGDLLSGLLLDGVQAQWQQVDSHGIGGPRMQERGFDAWWPSERLAVHGYSLELLRRLWGIVQIRKQLRQRLLAQRPDVFVGVDAPDFNLGLERDLRRAGVPTVHFVCPSIWAWRPERVHAIAASADHVLCLFPFEPALLQRHGIAASYVGHPLANVIPMQPDQASARAALELDAQAPVLALLPGSRSGEVAYLGQRFLQAAALVLQALPQVQIVLPAVPAQRARLAAMAQSAGLQDRLHLLDGQSHLALAACDCTLIASGTATLEAALFKRPMVIAYAMHPWSWRLMRRKQLQPWVGLPNILCQDFVVPELLQDAASPQALAQTVLDWLRAPEQAPQRIPSLVQRFTDLHASLQRDTPQLAAQAIAQVLRQQAASRR